MTLLNRVKWRVVAIVSTVTTILLAIVGLGVLYALALVPALPQMREVRDPDIQLATIVYSADGKELTRFYRENRTWVTYDQISPHLVEALVATEDRRFYHHWGIDVTRLFSSAYWTARGEKQGGSTITMQLARNLYPQIARSWIIDRKMKEIMTSFKIERHYSKDEIIEMYLNTVSFGYNAYGIESAARTYFNKKARDLDVLESATLVGMLKGPTLYNPVRNPELALERRNVVLDQMTTFGDLDQGKADRLKAEPLEVSFRPIKNSGLAPHFTEYVRQWLHDWGEQYGYDVYADGLRVYTTVDTRLQKAAVAAVQEQGARLQRVANAEWGGFHQFWNTRRDIVEGYVRQTSRFRRLLRAGDDPARALAKLRGDASFMDSLRNVKTKLDVGFVAMDPNTGRVLAWVGGRDFERDQFDKVALAHRQPGSAFKPFVYATAIDNGYSPFTTVSDSAVSIQLAGSNRTWTPRNAGGNYSGRQVSLRDGLAWSLNTVTTRLVEDLGPDLVATTAYRLGITSKLNPVPSIGLGTSEVTLLEMATAYSTLAAHGMYHEPVVVTRIEDKDGNVIASIEPRVEQAISMFTAYTTVDMMRDVINRGTGAALRSRWGIRGDFAGKTGTTQNNADGWFLAMNPNVVAGSWVGFNDRRLAFRGRRSGMGSNNALDVVGDFLRRAQAAGLDLSAHFIPPPGYIEPQPPTPDSLLYTDAYLDGADSLYQLMPAYEEDTYGYEDTLYYERADSLYREAIDTSHASWHDTSRTPDAGVKRRPAESQAPRLQYLSNPAPATTQESADPEPPEPEPAEHPSDSTTLGQ